MATKQVVPGKEAGDPPPSQTEDETTTATEESTQLTTEESTEVTQSNDTSTRASSSSAQSDQSNFSYHGLISYNTDGHPYVDINKLVYNPLDHHLASSVELKEAKKETLAWYLPDFAFVVSNLLSLAISSYFFLIGISILSWKSSMAMFDLPNCKILVTEEPEKAVERFYFEPCRTFYTDHNSITGEFRNSLGISFDREHRNITILTTGNVIPVDKFALILLCLEFINLVNVAIGINACLKGYKYVLIQHIALDSILVMLEFVVCAVIAYNSSCNTHHLKVVREILKSFIHWYGVYVNSDKVRARAVEMELDALQRGLECCGVDSWADYFASHYTNRFWPHSKFQIDDTEMVLPASCCRQWWIRNTYCSHGVHRWAHPLASKEDAAKFSDRISSDGCMYKIEHLCNNLRKFMGIHGFIATLVHFVFVLVEATAALILIKKFNNLIRDNKKKIRRKELLENDDVGEILDTSIGTGHRKSVSSSSYTGKLLATKVNPPTEDEIMTIKERSNFTRFMSKVHTGHIGRMMDAAQSLVNDGQEEEVEVTAQEKKQREKELLHARPKKFRLKEILKQIALNPDEHVHEKKPQKKRRRKKPKAQPSPVVLVDEPQVEPEPEQKKKKPKKKSKQPPPPVVVVEEPQVESEPKKKKPKKKSKPPPPPVVVGEEPQVEPEPKKKKPKKKSKPPPPSEEEEPVVEPEPVHPKKKRPKKKKPPPPPPSTEEETETEPEETKKKKRKRRKRKKRRVERPAWDRNFLLLESLHTHPKYIS